MEILTYLLINLLLFASWYALLFRKRELLRLSDRLAGSFILGLTQIIVTEMLLGVVFRKLFPKPLFILNIFISFSVLIFALSPGGGLGGIYSEIRDSASRIFRILRRDAVLSCIFILFLISICWIIFLGYLFPSYTWDALWYHLPMVGYISQSGAIQEIPATYFIEQFINIFPKNIELFFLWNTIFLKDDAIIDLSQFLFTLIGVLTVYSIARKLKINERSAVYSALLFFFTPILILQSTTNYVDIAVSVLFLVALNFLLYNSPANSNNNDGRGYSGYSRTPILLSGLATGILLGSKGSGPLFVIILTAAFMTQELAGYFSRNKLLQSTQPGNVPDRINSRIKDVFIKYLTFFILPALLLGGYWYIKNWVIYGSPVYPMEISIFNFTIFKGLYSGIIDPSPEVINNLSFLQRPLYVWQDRVKYYLYDSRFSGFGPLWFILFLPSLVFTAIYATKKKEYNFLFISAVLAVTFILYPRNWNTRYVIFIVGLGALSFGMVLEYFIEREKVLKFFALLLVVYTFLFSNSPCIMPEKVREFIHLPAEERTIARLAPFNLDLQARQEYGYWIWISKNLSRGETLAYTFEPLFHSPLWNREFSNRIVITKADNFSEWLKSLKEENVTYILARNRSMEDKWIMKEREALKSLWWVKGVKNKFKTVYSDENYKIIRFSAVATNLHE